MIEGRKKIAYGKTHETFSKLYKNSNFPFIMESKQISLFSGRFSLIGINPAMKLTGKNNSFSIEVFNKMGQMYLGQLEP